MEPILRRRLPLPLPSARAPPPAPRPVRTPPGPRTARHGRHRRRPGRARPRRRKPGHRGLQEIADRCHHLSRIARPRLDRLTGSAGLSPSELLTIAVELAAELTRAMEPDPLPPPQLLPRPWPGTRARELIARCWAALSERDPGEARPTLFRPYADITLYADITREAADRTTP
ncbi:PaaX family transcriptional regulator C-terminal domain-containing protein [Streptomyces sp. 2A115]|uniref:PaaX family transcriptional regulator C-terminal domain-containing protein n=1 Tax=Streptomyces sp. 2A115 TaxID=3457439 RepID=UPI003FD3EC5D